MFRSASAEVGVAPPLRFLFITSQRVGWQHPRRVQAGKGPRAGHAAVATWPLQVSMARARAFTGLHSARMREDSLSQEKSETYSAESTSVGLAVLL
jgi:hypothetical protein